MQRRPKKPNMDVYRDVANAQLNVWITMQALTKEVKGAALRLHVTDMVVQPIAIQFLACPGVENIFDKTLNLEIVVNTLVKISILQWVLMLVLYAIGYYYREKIKTWYWFTRILQWTMYVHLVTYSITAISCGKWLWITLFILYKAYCLKTNAWIFEKVKHLVFYEKHEVDILVKLADHRMNMEELKTSQAK